MLTEHSCFTETPIKIIVGPDEVVFHVHRERLCHYSTYFAGALGGAWQESQEGTIKLEDSVVTFKYFVDWLYSGEFDIHFNEGDNVMTSRELCELWVFADKRGVPLLQNAAIDALHPRMRSLSELDEANVAFVYDNTTEKSKLRRLFVDNYAILDIRSAFPSENEFPKMFLVDVLRRVGIQTRAIKKSRHYPQLWDSLPCGDYYEPLKCVAEDVQSITRQHNTYPTPASLRARRAARLPVIDDS